MWSCPSNWFARQTVARAHELPSTSLRHKPRVGPVAQLPSARRTWTSRRSPWSSPSASRSPRSSPRRRSRSSACYDRDGRILLFNEACERATGFTPRGGARPRRARLRDPARGARGVRRVPRLRLEDRHAEPAGRPLADQGRRPAADRVVEPADDRRRRRARRAGHHRHRPHRPRAAPRRGRARAARAIPRPSSPRSAGWPPSSGRCGGWPRWSPSEVSPERVFTAVSEECARVLQVNASVVLRYEGDGTATIVGRHNRDSVDVFRVGEALPAERELGASAACCAPARPRGSTTGAGRTRRDRRGDASASATARPPPRRSSSRARSGARSRSRARTRCRPTPRTGSARSASSSRSAVASAQARADLIASRARLVKAGDEQRRRLERNLHDGAQQRLVSVALKLRVARAQLERRSPTPRPTCSTRRSRELDTGLAGAARDRARPAPRDPRRARARAARWRRSPSGCRSPSTSTSLAERLPEHLEATAYYIVVRGADQRRQARGRPASARVSVAPRRRRPALRDRRRRPRRRRRVERHRHPRPARPRRGGRRDAVGRQPAGPRDGRVGRAAADRRLTRRVTPPRRGSAMTAGASAGEA